MLYDLGLDASVVGNTKFCVHPHKWYKSKTRIGGTKTLDVEKIASLKPTLVICNKEENVQEQIEAISNFTKIHLTDIKKVEDNIELTRQIGALTHKSQEANTLITKFTASLDQLAIKPQKLKSAAYLIWQGPYMTVGSDTYIHSVMHICGMQNIFADRLRYPETTIEELISTAPEVILLSSEPFPFKEKHRAELERLLPNSQIILVDGEAFSWYGTRLLATTDYLLSLKAKLHNT